MIRLGLALYLVFLTVTAPASLVSAAVSAASHGRVVLSETQGTIWSGGGVVTLLGPNSNGAAMRARWRLRPLAFLFGRVGADVRASGAGSAVSGVVEAGRKTLVLRNLSATLPAAWAALSGAALPVGAPDGQVRLEAKKFKAGSKAVYGAAVLTWQNAAAESTGALGSYRATLSGRGPDASIVVETLGEGELTIVGTGAWDARTGAAKLEGSLKAATVNGSIQRLLDFVGPEQAGGRPFLLTGSFPFPF